jgi:hypothetical protein
MPAIPPHNTVPFHAAPLNNIFPCANGPRYGLLTTGGIAVIDNDITDQVLIHQQGDGEIIEASHLILPADVSIFIEQSIR